ncbi:MAG: tRNA (adenosine(37)-N6)-threonylcarbamoyltransferase complex ATPase subunit type 1 TsaE [Oscillospiraceae bacterium]|nr:tRNA (adenosine(37)-N6)-threonylcarbamoyltransferase complex ATPase subunit type 1 TsaE [Oscillospiraceae bacterium]
MDYTTRSPRQTEQLGRAFGAQLQPGERVAFYGGLGAGKTAFIRGLAAGLGIQEPVTSPTYTVVNEYLSGRVPLFHFDLYRLSGADDLFDIGWEDYLQRSGICAVEWSENAPEALEGAIEVRITPGADDESRIISITGGERFADLSD